MAAASPISLDYPAGGPRQTKRQSPTGVSPAEPTPPSQPTPAASVQQLTQKTMTIA